MTVSVLFVCMGNICRSPTAHGVFEKMVKKQKLSKKIRVDSAGTSAGHKGAPPDKRAVKVASSRKYKLSHLRARLLVAEDFESFDYILGMDADNLEGIEALKPAHYFGECGLFLQYGKIPAYTEVPDPYYGGEKGFELVFELVESAAAGLLEHIQLTHPNL